MAITLNSTPEISDMTYYVPEGGMIIYNLLFNVGDLEGDTLSISLDSIAYTDPGQQTAEAEFSLNDVEILANGGFTYRALHDLASGEQRSEIFTFTLFDGIGTTTFSVTVIETGTDPTVQGGDDYSWILSGQSVVLNVLANDGSALGDTLLLPTEISSVNDQSLAGGAHVVLTDPTSGVAIADVSLSGVGSLLVASLNGFVGKLSFDYDAIYTYNVVDEVFTLPYSQTVTVDVLPAPQPAPVGNADLYHSAGFAPMAVNAAQGVLANDSSNGSLIRAQLFSGPQQGTLDFNSDGSFVYTPSLAMMTMPSGSETNVSFSYTVFNGTAKAATPTLVTLNFVQEAAVPVAVDDALSLQEDVSKTIFAADLFGADGNGALNDSGDAQFSSIAIEALSQHGALYLSGQLVSAGTIISVAQLDAGALEYRPAANYFGGDAIQYRVSDGLAYSNAATVALTIDAQNDAPLPAASLNFTVNEGQVLGALPDFINLVAFTIDPDDPALGFRLLDVSHGPNDGGIADGYSSNYFSLSADGYFTYDSRYLNLQPGQQQTETFHYQVTDGQNVSDGYFNVIVNGTSFGGLQAAPDDYAMTVYGQAVSVDVTLNDPLVLPLSMSPHIVGISGLDSFEGMVSIADVTSGIGLTRPVLTFTPAPGFSGLASFSYQLTYEYSPGPEQSVPVTYSANVTVTVVPDTTVDAPDGVADTYALGLFPDVTVYASVLTNDFSPQGAAVAAQLVSGPEQGTLDFNANGSFTYHPTAAMLATAPGTVQQVTFTYRVMNGSAADNDATLVTLQLRTPAAAPTAVDDHLSGSENQPLVITADSLFGTDGSGPQNDSQQDGLPFTEIRILSLPGSGTLLLDGMTVTSDTVVSVAQLAAGTLIFMPSPNFTGSTSFDYAVRSSDGYSEPATVTIDIADVAQAPVPISSPPQPLLFTEAVDATAQQLLGTIAPLQFHDVDSATLLAQASVAYAQLGNGGTIPDEVLQALSNAFTISQMSIPDGDGTLLTVMPQLALPPLDLDFLGAGQVMLIVYQVVAVDGSGLHSVPYIVPVQVSGTNDAPRAVDLQRQVDVGGSVGAGSGLLSQVTDPDAGDTLGLVSVNGLPFGNESVLLPTQVGSLTINADGSFSILPNFAGIAMAQGESALLDMSYQVADSMGALSTATLHLTIRGINEGPVALADQFGPVIANGVTQFSAPALLGNDFDPDNGETALLQLAAFGFGSTSVTLPTVGSTTLAGTYGVLTISASGQLSYAATTAASADLVKGAQASDAFTYTIADPHGATSMAQLLFTVIGDNHAPLSVADIYSVAYGQALTVAASSGVLENDSDADGDTLSSLLDTGPAHGNLTLNADGSFTYTPFAGYVGADSFSYLASDGSESGASTLVTISIQPPPLALDKLLFINEIAVNAGAATVTINTNNGALPDKVTTGVGRIELFNFSSGSISATDLAKARVEVVGMNSKLSVIGLDHLTGLTESANGVAQSGVALQAHGSLVLYEPNASGIGIWQTYSASGALLLSGTYQDNSWGLGASVSSAIAVNLVEAGLSIDYFAANGAPVSGLTDTGSAQIALSGIGTLASGAHDAGSISPLQLPDLSSPWFGSAQLSPSAAIIPGDVLSLLNQNLQFNASLASSSDTVFARTYDHYLALSGGSDPAFVDYNDAGDWTYGSRGILTLGRENVVLSKSAPAFVANAQDASDDLNPLQGYQPSSDLIIGIANESGQTIAVYAGYGEGGRGHDFLYGVASNDILIGGAGNDYLYGSAGNDWLEGGSGADRLMGSAGNDRLFGSSGRDWLNGGIGADSFVFLSLSDSRTTAVDIIEDFVHGIDKIDLSAIDANTKRAGDQTFAFAGRATTVAYNAVNWFESGGNTVVQADVDGNKTADLQLTLLGTNLGLTASDFVL